MTPKILMIYKKEHEKEEQKKADLIDYTAWLNGLYVKSAIAVFIDKRNKYPTERFGISEEEVIEDSSMAAVRFDDWAREANRVWKTKRGEISGQ